MIINHCDNVIFLINSHCIVDILLNFIHVPDNYGLVLGSRSHETACSILRDPPDPFIVLAESLQQISIMRVPYTNSLISRATNQKVSIRFEIFYTRYFVLMTFQSFVAFKLLFFANFP
jgi:hypothetical protein